MRQCSSFNREIDRAELSLHESEALLFIHYYVSVKPGSLKPES